MIITILLCAIAVASILQPNAQRLFAGLVFAGFILLHELTLSGLYGFAYCGSAALFGLAIIATISGINPIPRMVVRLQIICAISACLNLAGWVTGAADFYEWAFVALYSWTVIVLLKRDNADARGYGMDSWRSCFRFADHPVFIYFAGNEGRA